MIHDCESFQKWLHAQPAAILTLESATGDRRRVPEPKSKTSMTLDVNGATWYRGHVGGGGCLSGWYDRAHGLVALRDQYDTYQDLLIFRPDSVPPGVRTRDLTDVKLNNGIAIGMSRRQVEAVEGKGLVVTLPDGVATKYHWWFGPVGCDLSFRFRHDRLIAIDYGYGA